MTEISFKKSSPDVVYIGYSHSFDVGVAQKLGLNCAVVFNHILYWLKINHSKGNNFHEDKTWMYESQKEIAEFLNYLSLEEVKRAIVKLLEYGLLIKGNFNKSPFDKTAWYTVSDQNIIQVQKTLTKAPDSAIGNATKRDPERPKAPSLYNVQEEHLHKEQQHKQHAPTGARAAVIAPQKVKESKPAIHACLEKEDIPIIVKDELTRRYDAKTVQNAIDFTQANRSKIKTTYVAYLKMACSKGLKIENYDKPTTSIEPSEETIFEAREYAKKFIKDNWNQCKSSVTDRVDHVRIGNDKLYYNDPKYYDLFKHYLRKLR